MKTSSDIHQQAMTGMLAGGVERRVNVRLRMIFEDACRITAPFFDPAQSWGGRPLAFYARQTLCDAYPDLCQQDMAILFSVV
ncbi:MAG: hypothetical protein HY016_09040 [Nitrosomonadales bacterium]|nr:hypothetical protein [Nitrosomonadales bacterium]